MAHTPSADDARARFAAATAAHLEGPLTADVTLESVDAATWDRESKSLWPSAEERPVPLDMRALMTDDERARGDDLHATQPAILEHRVLLRAGAEVVGAYWGQQEPWLRYYMINSVVRRDWQRRGLYRALLTRVIAAATDAGFREIWSRHRTSNNAVIIPKLKAGFTISGLEVTTRFGMLVHLRYFASPTLRAAFEYRVDGSHADVLRAAGVPLP